MKKENRMHDQCHELKARSLADVVRLSLQLYRDHFGLLLGIAAIGLAPLLLLPVLKQVQFVRYDLVSSFLTVMSGAVVVGMTSLAVGSTFLGKPPSIRQIMESFGRRNPFAVLGGALLVAAAVVVFALLRIALSRAGAAGTLVLTLAAILTLWALARWSLFAQSAAVENHGVLASLHRSFKLVKGGFWRTAGLLLLLLVAFVGLPAMIGRALGVILISKMPAAGSLLALVGVLFAMPVFAAGMSLLYFDLRVRREDLSAAALGAEMEGAGAQRAGVERDESYVRKRNALVVVLGANAFLIALKFILAAISGSVSIAASGWMSVENFFLTSVVLFGLLVSVRDQRFSKRMSLFENIMAIVISAAVLYIAGEMFVMMFVKMAHSVAAASGGHSSGMHSGMTPSGGVKYVPIVTIAAALGAAICYFMSQYKIYVGRACGSASIEAAGRHCRVHVYMEIAVIIGLIGAWIGLDQLSLLTSAFVLAYVIYTGISIFWRGYRGIVTGSVAVAEGCHPKRNFRLLGSVVAAMLVMYAATGIYVVGWNESGVVRRFGTQIALARPGLHYHLPWPVERVEKVRMDEVRVAKTKPLLLVAGDENIVKVQLGVHYSVKNAADYVFNVGNPDKLVLGNAEAAVREVVGGMSIIGEEEGGSYLLASGKSVVEKAAAANTQALLDRDGSGVKVLSVQVLALEPPDEVADAFRDIASAMEERQTYIHEAEEYRNQTVTEASGKAKAMVRLAEGYRVSKVNNARGEAGAYLQKLSRYQKARAITNIRLYLETMEKILPGVKKVFVDSRIKKETTDLWLMNEGVKGKVVGFE